MSRGERWVYAYIAVVCLALIVLVILGHIPGLMD
jgi:hypothetical protein